jgi:uncharacterized membrane protein YozB (DUF420 family)
MLIAVSTLAVALIALGWKFRRRAKPHMALMGAAFLVDFCLLLYIEITRHAINTLNTDIHSNPASHGLLFFHVSMSLVMLVLYIAQIASGIALYKTNSPAKRRFHAVCGLLFVVCRLANYITSYFVVASL